MPPLLRECRHPILLVESDGVLNVSDATDDIRPILEATGHGIVRTTPGACCDGIDSGRELSAVVVNACDGDRNLDESLAWLDSGSALAVPVIVLHQADWDAEGCSRTLARAQHCFIKPVAPDSVLSTLKDVAPGDEQMSTNEAIAADIALPMDAIVSLRVRIRSITEARSLATFLSRACPEQEAAAIGLLELFINSIEHGNLGISYDEKSALLAKGAWLTEVEHRLHSPVFGNRASMVSFDRSNDGIPIEVQDQGDGFDPRPFLKQTNEFPTGTHGRGILLAKNCGFSSLKYQDGGRRAVVEIAH